MLSHFLNGLFVKDRDLKKDVANLIAVSISIDSIVRKVEVDKGCELLEKIFDGDDYEFLVEEVDELLEKFKKDASFFMEQKQKAFNFIKNSPALKENLLRVVEMIFSSDYEIHNKEQEILEIFKKETR